METSEIKQLMKKRWNRASGRFDRSPGHGIHSGKEKQAWMDLLAEAVGKEGQKILDVSTGTGVIALLLAEMGHQVTGIDIAQKMLEKAAAKARELNLNLKLQIGDAENPPFPDNSFDVVINRHVVWSLPHPEKAMAAWKRVLKPSGRLVIIDGDWRKKLTFPKKIWRFFALLLILVTERRLAWLGQKKLEQHLPMRQKERPEADMEMLRELGFGVSVKTFDIPRGQTFLSYLKYGYIGREQFVVTGVKR